jgi:glycosyltransferase involved in cell wall biosynthesis
VSATSRRQTLVIAASTYPRWAADAEPAFVHQLAKRLTNSFDVIVVTPGSPGAKRTEILEGVQILRYRYAPQRLESLVHNGGMLFHLKRYPWKWLLVPTFMLGQVAAVKRIVSRRRVDVVHAHWLIPQGFACALALLGRPARRPRFVVTTHGGDLFAFRTPLMQWIKRWVVGHCDAATAVSASMAGELASYAPRLSVSVLPMGVDLDKHFVPQGRRPRRHTSDAPRLLYVGRLVEKKGVHVLIDAMAEVCQTFPNARLTVVGFGPEQRSLEKQAAGLGLEHSVIFAGPRTQNDLPEIYRDADILVAPFIKAVGGDQDGLGLVLVEAMGCGCPVITSDLPVVKDVLGDDWPFQSPRPGDPKMLAASICAMLSDPSAAELAVQRARGRLLNQFGWAAVASRYSALLGGEVSGEEHAANW